MLATQSSLLAAVLLVSGASGAQSASPTSGPLAPPPAVEAEPPPAAPTETEAELARADRQDSGRGLEFVWLNAEAGVEHVGLQTFHAKRLVDADAVKSTQTGAVFGAGAGLRLIFLTAGARFRLGTFSAWQLWTLNAEFGLRLPLGSLEPYFTLGGGYASLGSFDSSRLNDIGVSHDLSAHGFDLRAACGLDYYLGHTLSIGANLSGDFLFLSRAKAATAAAASTSIYAQDGSSIGAGATLTAVAGLHF
jgi:hypothetical protein